MDGVVYIQRGKLYNSLLNENKNFSIFSSFADFKAKIFSFEHSDKNDFEKEMVYSGYVQKNKKKLDGIIFDKYSEKFIFEVGKIAEKEGHHPDISFGWGYAKIKISTHAIKGLAESDFILAAKINNI